MTEPVKPKRRYDSPRRREQAAATRRDDPRGGPAAVRAATATRRRRWRRSRPRPASRSRPSTSPSRPRAALLRALWHLLLRGDEDDAPVGERHWYREVLEEPDPERQLRLNARNARVVKQRAARAARGHPRRGRRSTPTSRRCGAASSPTSTTTSARSSSALDAKGALAPGLDVDARDRHPLDAQPPRRVAAARRRARLDARAVRAVVRRHGVRAAPRALLPQPASTGSSAASLTSVSASSAAGSESRTTPTPA